jgi:hypothetical protein
VSYGRACQPISRINKTTRYRLPDVVDTLKVMLIGQAPAQKELAPVKAQVYNVDFVSKYNFFILNTAGTVHLFTPLALSLFVLILPRFSLS